jgi:uncharacterized protein with PQ loop repeat
MEQIYTAIGVIIAIASTMAAVWFMFRVTKGQDLQTMLANLFFFILIALTCVFVCDKLIGVRADLLTERESDLIFELIKGFSAMIVGFILRDKIKEPL